MFPFAALREGINDAKPEITTTVKKANTTSLNLSTTGYASTTKVLPDVPNFTKPYFICNKQMAMASKIPIPAPIKADSIPSMTKIN